MSCSTTKVVMGAEVFQFFAEPSAAGVGEGEVGGGRGWKGGGRHTILGDSMRGW